MKCPPLIFLRSERATSVKTAHSSVIHIIWPLHLVVVNLRAAVHAASFAEAAGEVSYQAGWVRKALKALVLQQLSEVADVARGESERVQLGQFGVRWHPGQAGFQSGEGSAQHSHARPLARVGRVPLRLARLPRLRLGESAAFQLPPPPPCALVFRLLV